MLRADRVTYGRSFEMLPWNKSPVDTERAVRGSICVSTVIDFVAAQRLEDAGGANLKLGFPRVTTLD